MELGFHHVCFTVSDIQRSIKFYREILGLKLMEGPRDVNGEGSNTPIYTGLPGARLRVALFELFRGSGIELIQYLSPQGEKRVNTRRCDVGSAHICFTVDNAFTVFKRFKAEGVQVVSEPVKDSRGNFMFYFHDPDGYTMEITELKRKGMRENP